MKKRWLTTLQSGYWKAREHPDPQEVLDAAIVLYSLQYLNSDVHFGAELQQYVVANSAEARNNSKLDCLALLSVGHACL